MNVVSYEVVCYECVSYEHRLSRMLSVMNMELYERGLL